jgi:hypothetical protein
MQTFHSPLYLAMMLSLSLPGYLNTASGASTMMVRMGCSAACHA